MNALLNAYACTWGRGTHKSNRENIKRNTALC
jgi:hypothetical protein